MSRPLRVGIVCGCLGAPMVSVGRNALFHQVAATVLADMGTALRVRMRPIDDFRVARMLAHLRFLVIKRSCDVLAFQIRPSLLRQAAIVTRKERSSRGTARVRLSPYYLRDFNEWSPPSTLTPTVRFHKVNYVLARVSGLQHRVRMQVTHHLQAVAETAREELRRPIVFIGPVFNNCLPPPLDDYWTPVVRDVAEHLGVRLVDLCDIRIAQRPDLFESDGFHMNRQGHRVIGERFAAAIAVARSQTTSD